MIEKEKESLITVFNGLNIEQRTYMLSLFSHAEILAELNERLSAYEVALIKIQETVTAT